MAARKSKSRSARTTKSASRRASGSRKTGIGKTLGRTIRKVERKMGINTSKRK